MLDLVDYELLPEEAWTRLQQWYTLAAGQQPIARKVRRGWQRVSCQTDGEGLQ